MAERIQHKKAKSGVKASRENPPPPGLRDIVDQVNGLGELPPFSGCSGEVAEQFIAAWRAVLIRLTKQDYHGVGPFYLPIYITPDGEGG